MAELIIAYGIGLLGLCSHWFKKYTRKQTFDNLQIHFTSNFPLTMATLGCLAGAVAGILSVGIDLTDSKDIAILFLAGYNLDSIINKNSDQ